MGECGSQRQASTLGIIVHGHTHEAEIRESDGILFVGIFRSKATKSAPLNGLSPCQSTTFEAGVPAAGMGYTSWESGSRFTQTA